MRRIIALLIACAAAGALAQAGNPSGPPKPEPPDVTKLPFTQDSIKQVVAYYQDQIQGCYEEMLAGMGKPVEGRLMTTWVIAPDGAVKNAKVVKKGTTLKNPKLHACVLSVLEQMTFPKPVDGRNYPIEYPFNLKAIK